MYQETSADYPFVRNKKCVVAQSMANVYVIGSWVDKFRIDGDMSVTYCSYFVEVKKNGGIKGFLVTSKLIKQSNDVNTSNFSDKQSHVLTCVYITNDQISPQWAMPGLVYLVFPLNMCISLCMPQIQSRTQTRYKHKFNVKICSNQKELGAIKNKI